MASVSSTNSTTNSFFNTYGNANAVTGLASGMDTEGMIEQAVSGFQKKIETLQQRQTLLQWKQAEMRSLITMLNGLNSSYTSYTSKTNLFSPSFFTGAMTYGVTGKYADKISAVGGSKSSISINSVAQLATAATYRVNAGDVFKGLESGTGEKINWDDVGDFTRSYYADKKITVTLDGVSKSIRVADLGKVDNIDDLKSRLQNEIDKAFGKNRVTVADKDGALSFSAVNKGSMVKVVSDVTELGLGKGVSNYVDTLSTKLIDALGKDAFKRVNIHTTPGITENKVEVEKEDEEEVEGDGESEEPTYTYTYTWNGKTYTADDDGNLVDEDGNAVYEDATLEINGAKITVSADTTVSTLISKINSSSAGVTATYSQLTNQLTFTAKQTGSGGRVEFGGDLGDRFQPSTAPGTVNAASLFGDVKWDANGEAKVYINGTDNFTLKKTDTMEDLINNLGRYKNMIKYDSESGTYGLYDSDGNSIDETKVSFSIPDSNIKLNLTDMVGKLNSLGPVYTAGQDARLNVTVNGENMTLTRSTNTFDLDGMTVTLEDTFNVDEDGNMIDGEPVTFTGKVDTESIVSAIKSFVEDYNSIMKAVREAYTTQPLEKSSSSHEKYKPLTESDKEGLSDKTIEEYEAKAKTGLLYMDSDLSRLYSELSGILTSNRGALAEIGISVEYDSNSRSNFLKVDEDKLSAALEGGADKVAEVFSGENGLMSKVQTTVNKYASTSIGSFGILVAKAGATESAISQRADNNTYQKQLEDLENQIDKLKSKLSTKVDYYTRQFSLLEQLMSNYNNQSSMLMSMMGY